MSTLSGRSWDKFDNFHVVLTGAQRVGTSWAEVMGPRTRWRHYISSNPASTDLGDRDTRPGNTKLFLYSSHDTHDRTIQSYLIDITAEAVTIKISHELTSDGIMLIRNNSNE